MRNLVEALDVVPYVMVLAYPFAFFAWMTGLIGEPPPGAKAEDTWWFVGFLVALLYLPSLLVCALTERWARKHGRSRLLLITRTARWVHFLVTFGPIVFLILVIMLPPRWQPI
ncbi:hypothetical protein [Aureimonas ureilytica]|uniref:hypothetical protein n=1 Tax=Aureimonas ureilytica TaxID=401562 RepID=UPI00038159FF|nr:hypothetical protein [Aureimonas ureilytica]